MRQSASTAHMIKIENDMFVATVVSANINGITCNIKAEFPHQENAQAWLESFGFSEIAFRILTD